MTGEGREEIAGIADIAEIAVIGEQPWDYIG
jgi:hypothetical protein